MGSFSQGPTFVSSTWDLDTLAQIGAAPARHLCLAAEFLERMVNMGIKAIKDHLTTMITMVNMVKMITIVNTGIKDRLVTMGSAGNKVAAVTNLAITTLRSVDADPSYSFCPWQGPRPSNV